MYSKEKAEYKKRKLSHGALGWEENAVFAAESEDFFPFSSYNAYYTA